MKTIFIILAALVLALDLRAQVPWREATTSEVNSGTMGTPAAITPRRLAAATKTNVTLFGTATLNGANLVTNNATGVTLSGTFSGNGSGLTNLSTYITTTTNIFGQTNTTPTTYTDNPFAFTLSAGKWSMRGFLKLTTASTTSGIQCQLIQNSGSAFYRGGFQRGGSAQQHFFSEAASSLVFASLVDASGQTAYGETVPEIIIDVPSSVTIAPQIYQRTAIDVANRPVLTTNSWLMIQRLQ